MLKTSSTGEVVRITNPRDLRAIDMCPATRTVTTRYVDHAEWEHGLEQGSPPCTCRVRICKACPICGREMPASDDVCSLACFRRREAKK